MDFCWNLLGVVSELPAVLSLGILLCSALVGGLIAQKLRLPRVTAYLLVGLLFSPATFEIFPSQLQPYIPRIPEEHLRFLHPIGKLAMALVLFGIGCHFPLTRFKRILRRVLRLSAGELGLTFLLVGFGLWALVGVSWQSALLFGALALATAPATTILVLKENESEGPITEYATALVAVNNLVAIVLFEMIYRTVHYHYHQLESGLAWEFGGLAGDLLGSAALGIVAGLLTALSCSLLSRTHWLVMLVGMSTLVLGICGQWGVPYLLAFLAMGATMANASDQSEMVVAELDRFTGLVCVIFFVIHGAEMDISALASAGMIGVAYIILRSAGKYLGIFFAVDAHHDGRDVKNWLGSALISQAGAAIALSAIAAQGLGETGKQLQDIVLGTVIFFELTGPILIRLAILQAGEVPMAQAIRHSTTSPLDEIRRIANRLLGSFGFDPFSKKSSSQLSVKDLMRKNVKPIPVSASFDEVVTFLEESRDNTLPVVGESDELLGVIDYENLRHALFDPQVGLLVRAEDLAVPSLRTLYPDDSLERALQRFQNNKDDAVVVVTREQPHQFLGLVRRGDLFRVMLRKSNGD